MNTLFSYILFMKESSPKLKKKINHLLYQVHSHRYLVHFYTIIVAINNLYQNT